MHKDMLYTLSSSYIFFHNSIFVSNTAAFGNRSTTALLVALMDASQLLSLSTASCSIERCFSASLELIVEVRRPC